MNALVEIYIVMWYC